MRQGKWLASMGALAVALGMFALAQADDQKQVDDQTFAKKVSMDNLAEINLGRVAAQNATDPQVKAFAMRLVEDHSRANAELNSILDRKGWKPAQQMDKKHRDMFEKMSKMQGADFDKHFVSAQLKGHKEDVKLFENFSKDGKDEDLKAFATKTLPVIKEHLEMARRLAGPDADKDHPDRATDNKARGEKQRADKKNRDDRKNP